MNNCSAVNNHIGVAGLFDIAADLNPDHYLTAIFLGNIAIGRYTCLNIGGAILTDLVMVTGDGTCGNLNFCLQSMC